MGLDQYIDQLKQDPILTHNRYLPFSVEAKLKKGINSDPEAFQSDLHRGHLCLTSSSELGLAYGINYFITALHSGYFESFKHACSPSYKLRPLWLKGRRWVTVENSLYIQIPSALLDIEAAKNVAIELISLGYNALVIGAQEPSSDRGLSIEEPDLVDLEAMNPSIQVLKSYGVQIIAKPIWVKTTKRSDLSHHLKKVEESGLQILIEKSLSSFKTADNGNKTRYENCIEDIKFFQSHLSNRLIYYITSSSNEDSQRVSLLLRELMDDVDSQTILAFNLMAESAYAISGKPHPFLHTLLQIPYPSSTGFLPIFNGGCLKRGEGFWPIDPLPSLHVSLELMSTDNFVGVVNLCASIPMRGQLLHYLLWMVAQQLWNPSVGEKDRQAWAERFVSTDGDNHFAFSLMRKMASITEDIFRFAEGNILSGWSFQNLRIWCESLLMLSQSSCMRLSDAANQSNFADQVHSLWPLFEGDLRRLLINTFNKRQMPLPNIQVTDSQRLSYWFSSQTQGNIQEQNLLKEPHCPQDESLAAVYDQVRYIT